MFAGNEFNATATFMLGQCKSSCIPLWMLQIGFTFSFYFCLASIGSKYVHTHTRTFVCQTFDPTKDAGSHSLCTLFCLFAVNPRPQIVVITLTQHDLLLRFSLVIQFYSFEWANNFLGPTMHSNTWCKINVFDNLYEYRIDHSLLLYEEIKNVFFSLSFW